MLLELYLTFFQVGIFSFGGGYAALPFIQNLIVEQNAWLTLGEMTDVISISQMTPGPIAINAATFVGTKLMGIPGAVVATLGVVTPQFIIMMLLSRFIFSGERIKIMENILKGLKPAVVGLIAIATITMIVESLLGGVYSFDKIQIVPMICFAVGFVLYLKKVDLIKLIILGAVMGIILHLIF
ncbi:MAG: chromate transporter [Tissierellia bacterium]|nr:chromate transporter [Tissierellia bacterium]